MEVVDEEYDFLVCGGGFPVGKRTCEKLEGCMFDQVEEGRETVGDIIDGEGGGSMSGDEVVGVFLGEAREDGDSGVGRWVLVEKRG